MATISTYAELILSRSGERLEEKDRRAIETIRRSSRATLDLLRDFFDWARSELKTLEVHGDPAPLLPRVNACLATFQPKAATQGVELIADLPSTLDATVSDADRLSLSIDALLDHALSRSAAGQSISVRLFTANERVVFTIEDSGPKLDRNERQRLFDATSQVSSARTLEAILRLPLASARARSLGGRVVAKPSRGGGLVVVLSLPLPANSRK